MQSPTPGSNQLQAGLLALSSDAACAFPVLSSGIASSLLYTVAGTAALSSAIFKPMQAFPINPVYQEPKIEAAILLKKNKKDSAI